MARVLHGILGREDTFNRAFNLAQEETPTLTELLVTVRGLLGSRAEIVRCPRIASERPAFVRWTSPFHDRWMSYLDPGRARA